VNGDAMKKIDSLIVEIQSVIEKLSGINARLHEIKEENEAIERARDRLRSQKNIKKNTNGV
jgi:prefoldin subunit 5